MHDHVPSSHCLVNKLAITANAVKARLVQEYKVRWALSMPEWRVMAVLGEVAELTQRELVKWTMMDKVAVNRACKLLGERKLVSRKANGSDGRSHFLVLTPAGRELHDQIMPLAREVERQVLDGFSQQDLELLRAFLDRVQTASQGVDLGHAAWQESGA